MRLTAFFMLVFMAVLQVDIPGTGLTWIIAVNVAVYDDARKNDNQPNE
jgi:hypothetical protein